jgi:hypothetical protein
LTVKKGNLKALDELYLAGSSKNPLNESNWYKVKVQPEYGPVVQGAEFYLQMT